MTSPEANPAGEFHGGASNDRHYSGYASGIDNGVDFIPGSTKGYNDVARYFEP